MDTLECEVDGCTRKSRSRGFCGTHYARLLRLGTTELPSAAERLAKRLQPDGTCLTYMGDRDKGYGVLKVDGKKKRAHRLAWELANGRSIPDGLQVCHTCDNPPCCNPAHLFVGTMADNQWDKTFKGRARNAHMGQTHCKRGHPFTTENTYLYDGRRYCRSCARLREAARRRIKQETRG